MKFLKDKPEFFVFRPQDDVFRCWTHNSVNLQHIQKSRFNPYKNKTPNCKLMQSITSQNKTQLLPLMS